MSIFNIDEKAFIKLQGIVKADGGDFIAMGDEISIPVIKDNETNTYKVAINSEKEGYLKLTDFLDQFKVDSGSGSIIPGSLIANNKFVDLNGTEVEGKEDTLYIDRADGSLYYFDENSLFSLVRADDNSVNWENIVNKPESLESIEQIEKDLNEVSNTVNSFRSTFATKTEVNEKLSGIYKYMGSVPTMEDLETVENPQNGHVYNVLSNGTNHAYIGDGEWDNLGSWTINAPIEESTLLKKTGEEIASYIAQGSNGLLFICSQSFEAFTVGSIYYIDSSLEGGYKEITGGGSGSGTNVIIGSSFNEESIKANTPFTIPYYWSSTNPGYGQVTLRIDNTIYGAPRRELQPADGAENEFVITNGLPKGKHTLSISVTDSRGIAGQRWTYTIMVGSLELISNFNDQRLLQVGSSNLISYEISAVREEEILTTILVSKDGEEAKTAFSGITNPGFNEFLFVPEEAGIYNIKIFSIQEESGEESNILEFNPICAVEGEIYIVNESEGKILESSEGLRVNFSIRLAKINNTKFNVTVKRNAYTDETFSQKIPETEVVQEYSWINGINTWTAASLNQGFYKFDVIVEAEDGVTATTQVYFNIGESLLYSVDPVTQGLVCWFDARDRSNNDSNLNYWEDLSVPYKLDKTPVNVKFTDFNFVGNGWMDDALVINGGAYAEIDLAPFEKEVSDNGMTFEIEFETENVLDPSAKVVHCEQDQKGFTIDTEYCTLGNNETKITANIVENRRIRISYVIAKTVDPDKGYPILGMYIYQNGIVTAVQQMKSDAQFSHLGKIILGTDYNKTLMGTSKIYNFRVYNRALSYEEIVKNYVADIKDPNERSAACVRNELVTVDDKDRNDIPMMIIHVKDEGRFNWINSNKDNKEPTVIEYIDPKNPDKNIELMPSMTSPQGTSSMAYPVKNYKIRLYKKDKLPEFEGENVSLTNPYIYSYEKKYKDYDLGNGITDNTFCLKADFMDSSHVHNTQSANLFAEITDTYNGCITPPMKKNSSVRNSIYGFPIRLYVNFNQKAPEPSAGLSESDLLLTVDPAKAKPVGQNIFLGIFNFNLDKGCLASFGLKDLHSFVFTDSEGNNYSEDSHGEDYLDFAGEHDWGIEYETIKEIVKEEVVDKENEGNITIVEKEVEKTIAKATKPPVYKLTGGSFEISANSDKSAGAFHIPVNQDGSYNESEFYKQMYNDFEMRAPELEEIWEEAGILEEDNEVTIEGEAKRELLQKVHYQYLKDIITWVFEADNRTFKADFEKHFNLRSVLDYYLFALVDCRADNLGKNLMLNFWMEDVVIGKDDEGNDIIENRPIWYTCPYDLDTCWASDNTGNIKFDTDAEMEANVFNTSNSKLWLKFRENFATEIKNRYIELRTGYFTDATYMKFIYDNAINKISEMDYNRDCKAKYLDHTDYLFMLHGSQELLLRHWINQRLFFMDTLFGMYGGGRATVRVSYADFDKEPVTFNVSTYKPGYVSIKFQNDAAGEATVVKKVPRNKTVPFAKYLDTATDQEIVIEGGANIKSLGRVDKYTPTNLLIAELSKLTELIASTDEYPNANLTTVKVGNNARLENVSLASARNIENAVLDLDYCTNLRKLDLFNSNITKVNLPLEGGALEHLKLGNATRVIVLNNFLKLNNLEIQGYDNIETLTIRNCPKICGVKPKTDEEEIPAGIPIWMLVNSCKNLKNAEIEGYGRVNDLSFLDKYLGNPSIKFSGKIHYTGTAIPEKFAYYEKNYPNLKIIYPNVTDVSGMFQTYKNIEGVYTWLEEIRDETTGEITNTITHYYWNYEREDGMRYDPNHQRWYEITKDTIDDGDALYLADTARRLLKPFTRLENTSSMFKNLLPLKFIHDDTFDHIDLTGCNTDSMFENTSLEYFTPPRTMNILGDACFSNCMKLKIYIPETVTGKDAEGKWKGKISSNAFYGFDDSINSHPLQFFEESTDILYNPNLSTDSISDAHFNIEKIEEREIQYEYKETDGTKKRTSVKIKAAFEKESAGGGIHLIECLSKDIEYFNWNNTKKVISEDRSVTRFEEKSPEGQNPLNIKTIFIGAFDGCKNLKGVSVPSSNRGNLSIMQISPKETTFFSYFSSKPNSTYIPDNLEIVRILPNKNKTISESFFELVGTVKDVYVTEGIETFEPYAFASIKENIVFNFENKNDLKFIASYCFSSMQNKQSMSISGFTNLESNRDIDHIGLGNSVFVMSKNLKYLYFNKNLVEIPESTCEGCDKLTLVQNISTDLYRFGSACFKDCTSLDLVIPGFTNDNGEKYSEKLCFTPAGQYNKNENLNNFPYFTKLQRIESSAFENVGSIHKIIIPKTVEYIGYKAFYGGSNVPASTVTAIVWETRTPDENGEILKLSIGGEAFANLTYRFIPSQNNYKKKGSIYELDTKTSIEYKDFIFVPSFVESMDNSVFASKNPVTLFVVEAESKPEKWNKDYNIGAVQTYYGFKGITHYDHGLNSTSDYIACQINGEYNSYLYKLVASTYTTIFSSSIYENEKYKLREILINASTGSPATLDFDLVNGDLTFDLDILRAGSVANLTTATAVVIDSDDDRLGFPESIKTIESGNKLVYMTYFASDKREQVYLNDYLIKYNGTSEVAEFEKETIRGIYDEAITGNPYITELNLPSTVETIGDAALKNCKALSVIEIPEDSELNYIGVSAFEGCSDLSKLYYPKSVRTVGNNATLNCYNISEIEFAEGIELTKTSKPITPTVTEDGVNYKITTINLPASLAEFFEPSNYSNSSFNKLAGIKNLFVGDKGEERANTPVLDGNGEPTGKYYIWYHEENGVPCETTSPTSLKPKGNYHGDLDLTHVDFDKIQLTREDLIRICYGFGIPTDENGDYFYDEEGLVIMPKLTLLPNQYITLRTADTMVLSQRMKFEILQEEK